MEPGSTGPEDFPPGEITIAEPLWRRFVPDVTRVVGRAMGLTGCPPMSC
jgi:hypothetical protein